MLFGSHIPTSSWVDVAIHVISRLTLRVLNNKSPIELVYGLPPNYDKLWVFGCRVFPYVWDYSTHKLSPQSIPCVFLGYDTHYKGYRRVDPTTSHVFITRNATFDEKCFTFSSTASYLDL